MPSRRGLPRDVLSDNGTHFIAANNELEELAALNGTSGSPLYSGVHEVMIKAAKKTIYAILSSAGVTDEEQLLSADVGAEGLINSRPLTYQPVNTQDLVPLSPNHSLHGQLVGR